MRKQRFFPPFLDLIIFCCSFYLPSRIVLSGGLKEWEVEKTRGVSESERYVGLVCPLFDLIPYNDTAGN